MCFYGGHVCNIYWNRNAIRFIRYSLFTDVVICLFFANIVILSCKFKVSQYTIAETDVPTTVVKRKKVVGENYASYNFC